MDRSIFGRYKLFIFDADDTLRRTTTPGKPCPHGPGEWVLMPGVRAALSGVAWGSTGGPYLGIASNQDQVAYGHLTLEMARRLLRDLACSAADFTPPESALQLCPHPLEQECECRKPNPGMLRTIMEWTGWPQPAQQPASAGPPTSSVSRCSGESSEHRSRRTPRPAGAGWYGAA